MGSYIAKLGPDAYCDWSTVVDAPVSWVVPRKRAVRQWGEERVARADRNGTSILYGDPPGNTPEQIVAANRAGPRETELTVEQIIEAFTPAADAAPSTADAAVRRKRILRGKYRMAGLLGPFSSSFTLAWLATHRDRLHTLIIIGKRLSLLLVWDSQGARKVDHDDGEVEAMRRIVHGPDAAPSTGAEA